MDFSPLWKVVSLCKDMFNRVQNHKDAHKLWTELCVLHGGTKSEHEEQFHFVMHKLNTFKMLPKENVNKMYSHLTMIVEELSGLGLNKMSPVDVQGRLYVSYPLTNMGT